MEKPVLPFQLNDWVIDPATGVAQRRGGRVHLEPKACELLCHLVAHRGKVVSREALLQAVWPNVIVGDEAITNAIAKLRRSLQDDPKAPRLIETIPKRGYRIIASVSDLSPAAPRTIPATWTQFALAALLLVSIVAVIVGINRTGEPEMAPTGQAALAIPEKPSIAVLPFINLSNDSSQEYFVDGLTEDLITDLSRVSGLFVIARNSSFAYKGKQVALEQLANELGVRYLVEGSARKIDSGLRLNIKLIDMHTGGNLWAQRYDSEIEHVFEIQNEVVARIVDALSVNVTEIERAYSDFQETHNRQSYDSFLKGWAEYQKHTPESFARAIEHFENAVAEDPGYGRAFAALAAIYWEAYQKLWYRRLGISPRSLAWQQANEYLSRSMVAPTPLAHKVASSMLLTNRRFDEALIEAKRAIAIDGNNPTGFSAMADIMISMGEPDRAEPLIRKAMRLDPRNKDAYLFILGKAALIRGEVAEAIASLETVTQNQPDDRLAWMVLISAYGLNGQANKAGEALGALNQLQRRDKIVSFTVANAREHWPFRDEKDRYYFLDGLRKAGVPEW